VDRRHPFHEVYYQAWKRVAEKKESGPQRGREEVGWHFTCQIQVALEERLGP
jgi:hypothetical protein